MNKVEFIEEVAKYVKKYAPQFNIKAYSAVIAQACLESGYGTSDKVYKNGEYRHNYFGLKWRDKRCAVSNDYFEEWTSEQNKDGSYTKIVSKFCKFKSLEDCVLGYFQWTNIANYSNLKGVTDPKTYLENIKADKYATSIDYVTKLMNVINSNNLTKYDIIETEDVMQLKQNFLTNNPCYKSGKKITIQGLMLHSVGCPQPSASSFVKSWNSANTQVCVHAFVDANNGEVIQTLPWNHRAWHCGSGSKGSGNNTHIGVEMCEPDCIKYTGGATFTCSNKEKAIKQVTTAYNSAVELFAYLCKEYKLNPLTAIISHSEGYKKGIASNHGDPDHLWRQLNLSYTMDTFRADVNNALKGNTKPNPPAPTNNPSIQETPYRIRKTWSDAASQKGAYNDLNNAKKACPSGYKVFNNKGVVVFPVYPIPQPTLKKGSSGTQVRYLQDALNVIMGGSQLIVDGSFGTLTYNKLKEFQKKYGLTVDGIYGNMSMAKMKSILL